ncbi:MAG TPA: hypothetical protein VFB13_12030 [Reyranella sp.]|jgi:hypothetical protein|nr:hypothetical protein [Reyranella sp.]
MKRIISVCAAFGLIACGTPPAGWERPEDNSASRVSDISQCRSEARRLALFRYPDQVIQSNNGATHSVSDPNRFAAELALFDQCMTRLGYRRTSPPSA